MGIHSAEKRKAAGPTKLTRAINKAKTEWSPELDPTREMRWSSVFWARVYYYYYKENPPPFDPNPKNVYPKWDDLLREGLPRFPLTPPRKSNAV